MPAEAKVGLLVVFVVLLVAGIAIYLAGYMGRIATYEITAQFSDAQGLSRESKVQLAGVRIGTVVDVGLREDKNFPGKSVSVRMAIQRDTPLYETDTFNIKQHGLLGDEYVAVTRGPTGKGVKLLRPKSTVEGGKATSTESIMEEVQAIVEEARASIALATGRLDDEKMWADMAATLANLNQATAGATKVVEEALRFTQSLSRTGEQSQVRVAGLLDHLVAASADVEKAADRVDKMIALSPLPAQLAAAGENLRKATSDMAIVAAQARQMAEDPAMQSQIATSVKNLHEASENVRKLTADAAELIGDEQLATDVRATLENVRKASESLRTATEHTENLVTDPKTTEDLRTSLENLRAATESGRDAAKRADTVLDGIDTAMASIRSTQSMIRDIETRAGGQARAAKSGGLRTDAYVDIRLSPRMDDYWRLGLYDVGDNERVSLQWAHKRGDDWLRAGLFGGKLGIGYDYSLGRTHSLEGELYDPDDLHLDLRGSWRLRQAYDLLLGVEDVGGNNDPFIGTRWQGEF